MLLSVFTRSHTSCTGGPDVVVKEGKKNPPCPLGCLSLSCALNQPPAAACGLNLTPLASQSQSFFQSLSNGYLQLLNVSRKHFKDIREMSQTSVCTYSYNFVCEVLHCVSLDLHTKAKAVAPNRASICDRFKYEY